jgi:AcrR family transcriptional regulator
MSAVARAAAAPSGSVYHRFPDRPAMLAALWSRTLARFQTGMIAALGIEPPRQAAVAAARHVIEWSRLNPAEARVLLAGAHEFGATTWPRSAHQSARQAQSTLEGALRGLGERLGGPVAREPDRLVIAVVDLPYATVRRYLLAGRPIPAHTADLVEQGVTALLAVGVHE